MDGMAPTDQLIAMFRPMHAAPAVRPRLAAGIAVSRDTAGLSMPSCGMPATIAIGLSIIAMPPDGHGMHHHTGSARARRARTTDGQARSADNRITQCLHGMQATGRGTRPNTPADLLGKDQLVVAGVAQAVNPVAMPDQDFATSLQQGIAVHCLVGFGRIATQARAFAQHGRFGKGKRQAMGTHRMGTPVKTPLMLMILI
jgi:hypothetical protein